MDAVDQIIQTIPENIRYMSSANIRAKRVLGGVYGNILYLEAHQDVVTRRDVINRLSQYDPAMIHSVIDTLIDAGFVMEISK